MRRVAKTEAPEMLVEMCSKAQNAFIDVYNVTYQYNN